MKTGFSLVEMLIVIAVLGIVLALGVSLLGNSNERAVREAQAQLAADLSRVRTLVQRFNVSYELEISSDKKTYTLTPKDIANTTVATASTITRTMNSITLEVASSVTLPARLYTAPFGRFGNAAPTCLELVGGQNYRAAVSLIGVTGKIIPRQVTSSATSGCV